MDSCVEVVSGLEWGLVFESAGVWWAPLLLCCWVGGRKSGQALWVSCVRSVRKGLGLVRLRR